MFVIKFLSDIRMQLVQPAAEGAARQPTAAAAAVIAAAAEQL